MRRGFDPSILPQGVPFGSVLSLSKINDKQRFVKQKNSCAHLHKSLS